MWFLKQVYSISCFYSIEVQMITCQFVERPGWRFCIDLAGVKASVCVSCSLDG